VFGDCHLRHLEFARSDFDQGAAADPRPAGEREEDLSAGFKDFADRITERGAILFFHAEVFGDPLFVETPEIALIARLKGP
jgi:hypothetical protein